MHSTAIAVATWLAGCHSSIVYKRLNLSSDFCDSLVAPSFRFLLTPALIPNSKGTLSAGAQNTLGVEKFAIFDLSRHLSQKWYEVG